MKNFKTGKFLAAAAAGAMMLTGAAAQAQGVITWNPGDPASGTPDGAGAIFNGDAIQTDRINMVAVNDNFTQSGTCTSGNNSCWNLNFDAAGNFTESFTFLVLTSTLSNDSSQFRRFGSASLTDGGFDGPFTESYVSVQATLSGSLSGGSTVAALDAATTPTQIADLLDLTYNSGTFAYSFHPNLDASDAGAAIDIGTFNLVSGSSSVGESDERIELGWDTVAANQLAPEWTDANGNPFDPFDTLLNEILQGVEVTEKVGFSDQGGGIAIFSRTAEVGFSQFPAVPEPGALALFGVGLIGLGALARRRSAKAAARA